MKRQQRIKLQQYKDMPYTMIGHSSLCSAFGISLTGKGLKEIVKKMEDEDTLCITVFNGNRATEFEIIKLVEETQ